MFNWDNPLAPPAPRAPDVTPELAIVNTTAPVAVEPTSTAHQDSTKQSAVRREERSNNQRTTFSSVAAKPVNVEDKRVVNGLADINQLAPFKYPGVFKWC